MPMPVLVNASSKMRDFASLSKKKNKQLNKTRTGMSGGGGGGGQRKQNESFYK